MTSCSRRRLLRGSAVASAGVVLGGCSGLLAGGSATQPPDSSADGPALDAWVPRPASLNGRDRYLLSDVVFWDHERIRSFEAALHPEFYGRITAVPATDLLGVSPADIDARIDVASQSASVYRGGFDPAAVASRLEQEGYTADRRIGSFDVFAPGDTGHERVVAVGESAVVVGEGASIQMAGEDDRSSEIDERAAAEGVVEARQGRGPRYADDSEAFRTLASSVRPLAVGTVATFDRVSSPTPEQLKFTGCVGVALGYELSRPASTLVMTFLFDDPGEAVVDPIRTQFGRQPGLKEYDDATFERDGSTVTARARMRNDRFDGHLAGGPGDRS